MDHAQRPARERVELETDGADESEAMEAVARLFADKFGEGE